MSKKEPKVAIVHDWLVTYAGADRVVDCMHHAFPNAVIYTLVYDKDNMPAWFKDYHPHHLGAEDPVCYQAVQRALAPDAPCL